MINTLYLESAFNSVCFSNLIFITPYHEILATVSILNLTFIQTYVLSLNFVNYKSNLCSFTFVRHNIIFYRRWILPNTYDKNLNGFYNSSCTPYSIYNNKIVWNIVENAHAWDIKLFAVWNSLFIKYVNY